MFGCFRKNQPRTSEIKSRFWGSVGSSNRMQSSITEGEVVSAVSYHSQEGKRRKIKMEWECNFCKTKKMQQASSDTVLNGHLISACIKLRRQLLKEMLRNRLNPSLLSTITDKISSRKMHSVKGVVVKRSGYELT